MPLFRSNRDIEFVKRITREVIERVVGEKVTYYPISKKFTRENIYGESKDKVFDPPVELFALVEWLEQDVTTNTFGQDIIYRLNVFIHKEHLNLQEVSPKEGDVIDYDNKKFEIHTIQTPTQIFGKSGRDIGVQMICQTIRESQFKVSISGTVDNAARTRPDEPLSTNPLFDDVKFPYSGSKND